MLRLLVLVSWPHLRKHLLRTMLTTAGIVLGVAVFLGMRSANQSVLRGFTHMVASLAGKTELQVTAGEIGFGEDILEKVQSASTVGIAAPVIEAIVTPDIKGAGSLLIVGVDMTGDQSLRQYDLEGGDDTVEDPLVFLAQPDSVILAADFARRNNLAAGSQLPVGSVIGTKRLTVRGIMKPSGLASAFGGNIAVMDIYAAQKMFGRGRTFDRIDLAVKDGATVDACRQELRALLGAGFSVERPSTRGSQFESMLAAYSKTIEMSSAFALFIGMFIIYNAFAVAVRQRRKEIGVLRALGATRGQIQRMFLGESALLGVVGSGIGVLFGTLIAQAVAQWLGAFIADMFRVADQVEEVATNPWTLGAAFAIGVATSLLAAFVPAREAARVDPVHAMRKGEPEAATVLMSPVRVLSTLATVAVAGWCLGRGSNSAIFYLGYAATIAAAILLAAPLSWLLARIFRPVLTAFSPIEGALAADSLIRSPQRSSTAIAALMLSLALAVAFGGVGLANYRSIVEWTQTTLNPDLFVIPSQSLEARSIRFPDSMLKELTTVKGVTEVQPLRNARVVFRDVPTMLVAFDMKSIARTVKLRPVAGKVPDMYVEAAAGRGLLVSDSLAQLRQLSLGDTVELAAPYGTVQVPIVGIIVDYSDQQGSMMIDRSVFTKYWHDTSVDMFRVYVGPDVELSTVREDILQRYEKKRQVFVLTNGELKNYVIGIVSRWFALTSAQVAVAVIVAILGIVNALTVSVIDRRRELGILQAIGTIRPQVRHTIWIEAVTVGMIGLLLGCGFGAVNLYYMLEIVRRDVMGLHLEYVFPVSTVLMLAPAIILAAFVAALWPAESAIRGRLLDALEYE
ncbi:MAG: ABC transporter permease [Acidobacteria bacterium]|nr:ABC transporter permease [Acidobacteriota bacterium]